MQRRGYPLPPSPFFQQEALHNDISDPQNEGSKATTTFINKAKEENSIMTPIVIITGFEVMKKGV